MTTIGTVHVEDGTVVCRSCEEPITTEHLRSQAQWLVALADWVETIPTVGEDD